MSRLLVICLTLFVYSANSQNQVKSFSLSSPSRGIDKIKNSKNEIIITGNTFGNQGSEVNAFLIKADNQGSEIWR